MNRDIKTCQGFNNSNTTGTEESGPTLTNKLRNQSVKKWQKQPGCGRASILSYLLWIWWRPGPQDLLLLSTSRQDLLMEAARPSFTPTVILYLASSLQFWTASSAELSFLYICCFYSCSNYTLYTYIYMYRYKWPSHTNINKPPLLFTMEEALPEGKQSWRCTV